MVRSFPVAVHLKMGKCRLPMPEAMCCVNVAKCINRPGALARHALEPGDAAARAACCADGFGHFREFRSSRFAGLARNDVLLRAPRRVDFHGHAAGHGLERGNANPPGATAARRHQATTGDLGQLVRTQMRQPCWAILGAAPPA